MPLPDRLIRSADRRVAGWRELEDQVNADLAAILGGDIGSRERTQLRRLAARLDRGSAALASDARVWLTSQLSAAWASGGIAAQVGRFEWTGAHRSALRLLVDDTFDELLANTRFMSRDVKQLVRSAGRLGVLEKVGSGTPAKSASRQLAERLRSTGVTSVTYADGRNIRASTYAEMLLRSKTAAAYNLGGLNQMSGAGVRYVECVDGADCGLVTHDDGDKPNGRILPVDVAGAYPQSHPNCRRDWIPRPDVRDDSESMVATSWRSPEQISDQANYERYLQVAASSRRQLRQARTARTTRTPRSPREVDAHAG